MTYKREKNTVLLFKLESTEGVDPTLAAANDAVLIENLQVRPQSQTERTNEYTGSLDGFGSIVGGTRIQVSFDVLLKGSGTAGAAPEFGEMLKACGLSEVITNAAVPASAEACGAGGSTTTAELGTSAGTTVDQYNGMPLQFSGDLTDLTFIQDYTTGKIATLTDEMGSAVDADVDYQILQNVSYVPASSSIPSGHMEIYMDGVMYKVAGARGNVSLSIRTGGIGRLSFTFSGMYVSKTDAAVPSDDAYDAARPPVFKNGVSKLERSVAAIAELSLDLGNTIVYPENPNAAEGFDPAQITQRNVTGRIDPAETAVATRSIIDDMRAGNKKPIHLHYGATAGNRVGVTVPEALYVGQDVANRQGLSTLNVPFEAVGQDSGFYLTFF